MTTTTDPSGPTGRPRTVVDDHGLRTDVATALARWPSAGLSVGVVIDGALAWFHGHGVADADTATPVMLDTAFRIASITKTFTAVSVLQLCEQGLVDLDAPVRDVLHAVRLVPHHPDFPPVTLRHLLTHTAGIGYWRRLTDLLHPGTGSATAPVAVPPPLSEYYRDGLPVEILPGTRWVYSNHGYAVLGQVVEDVTGVPWQDHLRTQVLEPLGLGHTGLAGHHAASTWLATGYRLGRRGLTPVERNGELPTPASGGLVSTTSDLARWTAALLAGGSLDDVHLLQPATVEAMFAPQFQPDPRIPGMGLGFARGDQGGHTTVGHTGIESGYLSAITLAPDDDIGVIVLANTGGLDGRGAPEHLAGRLLRRLLGLPAAPAPTLAPRPDVWRRVTGWYTPAPGPVTSLFPRMLFGAGLHVTVRHGRLLLKALSPVPALRAGLVLQPDDPDDPSVFRADLSRLGWMSVRVVFTGPEADPTGLLVDMMPFTRGHPHLPWSHT